jgi:membrane protein YdbS with pleckstrin-like domain
MKILRPSFPRAVGSAMSSLFWTSMLGAVVLGFVKLLNLVNRIDHPRHALSPVEEHTLVLALLAGFAVLAAFLGIHGLLSTLATRYVVGATDLTIRRGLLWRRTGSLPFIYITRIERGSGPLMRLFGLADLHVCTSGPYNPVREVASVVLRGLRNAEEVRSFLLDRRDSLQEAALRGDYSVARTPQELQLQRLAGAIERLEQRLPGASSGG